MLHESADSQVHRLGTDDQRNSLCQLLCAYMLNIELLNVWKPGLIENSQGDMDFH